MNFRIFIVIFLTLSEANGKFTKTYKKRSQSYNYYSFNLKSPATKTIFWIYGLMGYMTIDAGHSFSWLFINLSIYKNHITHSAGEISFMSRIAAISATTMMLLVITNFIDNSNLLWKEIKTI